MKDKLILACLLSNLFYSVSYPTVNKILITNITDNHIAVNSMIICTFTIILGKLWNKNSSKLIRYLPFFMIAETSIYLVLISGILNDLIGFRFYYIADTIIFAIVSKNIIFGANKLKALRYDGEKRNKYDNDIQIISNAASLVGFALNIVLDMTTQIAFALIFIGLTIDNLFYYLAYRETVTSVKA